MLKKLEVYFQKRYFFDARVLSIGRILIAFIILVDLIYRYQNLVAHYTNEGVLPALVLKEYYPFYQYYISIHNFFDTISGQKILFGFHFLITLLLLIGYKTRIFTLLSFLMLLSLHHRNPVILQGGDDLLRITLFYMIFLPWGRFYSVDSIVEKNSIKKDIDFSWIYVVLLLNVSMVYLFSAFLKNADEWRHSGTAIYYALSLDSLRIGLGNILYKNFILMKMLTGVVYYFFEIIVPLLLIFSFNLFIRNFAALMIIVLHLMIVSSLKVGIFPFVGISTAFMMLVPVKLSQKPAPLIPLSFLRRGDRGEVFIDFKFKTSSLDKIFSVVILMFVLRYNLATINVIEITLWEDRLLNSIGLSQRWNMFSPGVKRYEGWLILRGIKSDNSEWDIIHNSPDIHYQRTEKNFNFIQGDRWRKFLENYEQRQYNFLKPYYCRYLIRKWNEEHKDNSVEALNILFMKKTTLDNYGFKYELENLCLCNIQEQ